MGIVHWVISLGDIFGLAFLTTTFTPLVTKHFGPCGRGIHPPPMDFTVRELRFKKLIRAMVGLGPDGPGQSSIQPDSEGPTWTSTGMPPDLTMGILEYAVVI